MNPAKATVSTGFDFGETENIKVEFEMAPKLS